MSNTMELNKAAQARSDEVSKAARDKCRKAMGFADSRSVEMIQHAMTFDAARTAEFVNRLMRTGDTYAFIDGICAIHGQWARACLELAEKPNEYRYQSELGNI